MVELMINLRFNELQHHIQLELDREQMPLHPNYSTSVKSRGFITALQIT